MRLYCYLLLSLLLAIASFAGIAAPSVHTGPAPAWVIKVPPAGKQPNPRDVNDGYYLKLYEEEWNGEKDETYNHLIKEIISDAGIQSASNISVNFEPSFEQLTFHKVVVWRDGIAIDKLTGNTFQVVANEEEMSKFIYNGNYTAYLILKDIRKGDIIEYDYTTRGSNPTFNKKLCSDLVFNGSDPISQIHYSIIVPSSRQLSFKYYNNAPSPTKTVNNGNTVYNWELKDIPGSPTTTNSTPGWLLINPRVRVTEYKDWSEVVDWALNLNVPTDYQLKGELLKRVTQLAQKHGSDSATLLRQITNIVQNEVRYMGVEIGSHSHKANHPEKVYEQRYGDCKDKSLLLVAMLRSAGITAQMAWVNTITRSGIDDNVPSHFAFNHCIAVAHLAGNDIWIDPTISYQGGKGANFYCPNYGKALVLAPGNNQLRVIPETDKSETKYTEEYDVKSLSMPVLLTIRTIFSGSNADDERMNNANLSKTDMEKNYLEYYTKIYPSIEQADTLEIKDDLENNTFETIEHYRIPDFFDVDSVQNRYTYSFYAYMLKNILPKIGTQKSYPVAVTYPYKLKHNIYVNAPFGWNITPERVIVNRGSYSLIYEAAASFNRLSIEHTFEYLKDHIPANELPQYEKDYKNINDQYLYFSYYYSPDAGNFTHDTTYKVGMTLLFGIMLGAVLYRFIKKRTKNNSIF